MELYQLAYFLEIARQKHFTHAAERLNLAQPALSQQMHSLEAELGTPLFVRGRKQTHLTPAGEALLPCAEAMLATAEAAKQAVAEVAQLRGGRLLLATIPSVGACWLPEVIRSFHQLHPNVEIVLLEESSAGIVELVESGRAELGFLVLPVKKSKLLDVRELLTETFVLLAPSTHVVARQKSVRWAEVAKERLIFYKGRGGDTAFAACQKAGFEPRIVCESGELETVRALVGAGLGLAIVPKLAARELPKGVVAMTLQSPGVERKLGLVSHRGRECSVAAEEFAASACRYAQALVAVGSCR